MGVHVTQRERKRGRTEDESICETALNTLLAINESEPDTTKSSSVHSDYSQLCVEHGLSRLPRYTRDLTELPGRPQSGRCWRTHARSCSASSRRRDREVEKLTEEKKQLEKRAKAGWDSKQKSTRRDTHHTRHDTHTPLTARPCRRRGVRRVEEALQGEEAEAQVGHGGSGEGQAGALHAAGEDEALRRRCGQGAEAGEGQAQDRRNRPRARAVQERRGEGREPAQGPTPRGQVHAPPHTHHTHTHTRTHTSSDSHTWLGPTEWRSWRRTWRTRTRS